jgi:alpha-L-fucosidase 2
VKSIVSFLIQVVFILAAYSQSKSQFIHQKMMYADSTRRGIPYSKNPHVIRFGGKYLMYSSVLPEKGSDAREIEITESTDLIHWKNVGIMHIEKDYEKNGISAPGVIVKDGKVHMFYQTYGNGKNDAICHAVSDNGVTNFVRNPTNPVFRPDGSWNCGRAIDAEVFLYKGRYLLYYATRDTAFKIQMQGVAAAPENTDFSRGQWTNLSGKGPILKPELPWEGDCIEAASVIVKNGRLYMFYAGGYNNWPQQIGVAESFDGVEWRRLSENPFLANGKPGEWNSSESGHPQIFNDDDGKTYLFYQGNNDNGKTWFLSNLEVTWNNRGPNLLVPFQPYSVDLIAPERGFVSSAPAATWEQALVSGNGKYGALVFGDPVNETIILNHARLYMPLNEPLPPVNTGAHLAEIRKMIADGEYQKAADFVVALSKKEGYGAKRWTDPYIPVSMEPDGEVKNYSRSVDFSTGEASVNWSDSKGSYQRRLFVSRADDAVVLSISGRKSETFNCTLKLVQQPPKGSGGWNPEKMASEGIKDYKVTAEDGWLTYSSSFKKRWEGSIQGYEGVSRIIVKGGTSVKEGDLLKILGAQEVLVLTKIDLLKDYNNQKIPDLKASLLRIDPDYNKLLARHVKIHGEIFNRTRLDLGGGDDRNLTSEELIMKSKAEGLNYALIEKEYDAGRYNILSASGDMFPNLQGIWGGTYGPPWSGDFTLNGNVESAIAADLSANMAECLEPFFRFMEDHMDEFRLNAKNLYGARGIHIPSRASTHGLNNHFDETWPMTFWTAGAGWVSQFYYDYYLYTGDKKFLRERALPFMKEAALFYEDFLVEGTDGKYIFSPSYSPENNPGNSKSQAAVNSAMDIGVARELLKNCISACTILKAGTEDIAKGESMLKKIPDYLVDSQGSLREWSTPLLENNDAHRHSSHLYALYNGMPDDIASDPELVKAFTVAFEKRLELRRREFRGENPLGRPQGEMAFGIVQQGLTAASLKKADACKEILGWLSNNYWNSNLMTTHNPGQYFNTDLSGGFPALIIRMLVESQPGHIDFLPAWPADMPSGKIQGVALRGQIILKELSWNGKEIRALLRSKAGQDVRITANGEIAKINASANILTNSFGSRFLELPANRDVWVYIELK